MRRPKNTPKQVTRDQLPGPLPGQLPGQFNRLAGYGEQAESPLTTEAAAKAPTPPTANGAGAKDIPPKGELVSFRFDGRLLWGVAGQPVSAALLAHNRLLVGRSFKYHRPRGLLGAGSEEPNGLVTVFQGAYRLPNTRLTEIPLEEGLTLYSQNCFPSPTWDVGGIFRGLGRFLPAGFYYKVMLGPGRNGWRFWSPLIRRIAGLGRAPEGPDPGWYDTTHLFPETLIVGSGPAGLQAALEHGQKGEKVLLVETADKLGGYLRVADPALRLNNRPVRAWLEARLQALAALPNVTCMTSTTVTGWYQDHFLTALQQVAPYQGPDSPGGPGGARPTPWRQEDTAVPPRQTLLRIRAERVILATGALERPLLFKDNDRPGIMLAGSFLTYLRRFGVVPGRQLVVATNNDSAYQSALAAKQAGLEVLCLDWREKAKAAEGVWHQRAHEAAVPIYHGFALAGVAGALRVRGVSARRLDATGRFEGPVLEFACDTVLVSGGWTPTVHLWSQMGGALSFSEACLAYVPVLPPGGPRPAAKQGRGQTKRTTAEQMKPEENTCVGAVSGLWGLREILQAPGQTLGQTPGQSPGQSPGGRVTLRGDDGPLLGEPLRLLDGWDREKHFVDLQNDVLASDVRLACQEGYRSTEHLKRYTTLGMGTDQGKTSGVQGLAVLSRITEQATKELSPTTFRPPYVPITLGAVAAPSVGSRFQPTRQTSLHGCHVEAGAVFENVGDWKRPLFYTRTSETMDEAVQRESLAVRNRVGLFDASTLGKIELAGRDAVWLLEMLYTNRWRNLGLHRARYGVMLDENGMIFDDGVTTRLERNLFHMTTTTGGAARVLDWIEFCLQTEWPDKSVFATSVTEQWAVVVLAGPNAPAVLQALCALDLGAVPFMGFTETNIGGLPARLFRISFSGEQAFEINVPWRLGPDLWRLLLDAGAPHGITPYGTETMHLLRAEKGFIIVGQDTDGTVTPLDAGLDWLVASDKKDFLGQRSLQRPAMRASGRKHLIGFVAEERPDFVFPEGAALVEQAKIRRPYNSIGHISSCYFSPVLQRCFGLCLVRDGRQLLGQTGFVFVPGERRGLTIRYCEPVFYDKKRTRLRSSVPSAPAGGVRSASASRRQPSRRPEDPKSGQGPAALPTAPPPPAPEPSRDAS